MNKQRFLLGALVVATLLLLAPSCTSKKKLVNPDPAATYEWMTAKMTMDLSAPGMEFNNVSGTLRMRRDSVIWISASALMGMETVRALITEDTVVLLNRFNKTYLEKPLDEVTSRWNIPFTLQDGQRMLLGDGSGQAVLQFGPYTAKIRYSDIHWNEPITFPIKISDKYEKIP